MGLSHAKCTSTARLDGKIAIVTGSNTGIGKITAFELFKRGAHVIMACRNLEKANEAAEEIKKISYNNMNVGKLETIEVNLCSLDSVRKCAENLMEKQQRIDLLINNAGVMCCPYSKSEDGYEIQFASNHLGHFLLTVSLLPKIVHSPSARIINVSSIAHTRGVLDFNDLNWEKRPYSSIQAYQASKLCNVLFTKELAHRLKDAKINNVNVYCLHPGIIATELGRHLDDTYFPGLRWMWRTFGAWLIKTPEQGAQTTLYCAIDENAGKESGLYYAECASVEPSPRAQSMGDAEKLWDVSLEMCKLGKNHRLFV